MVIPRGGEDARGRVSGVLQRVTRLTRGFAKMRSRADSRERRVRKARREKNRAERRGGVVAFAVSHAPYASPTLPCSSSHSSPETSVSETSPATPTPWLYISSSESPADVPPWLEAPSHAESPRAPSRRWSLALAIVTRPDVACPTARSDRDTRGAECLSRQSRPLEQDAGWLAKLVSGIGTSVKPRLRSERKRLVLANPRDARRTPRHPRFPPRASSRRRGEMRVKRGVAGPRRPGATSLSSHAGTEDVVGARPRKPTQFDDQRPGWDFTSGDVGKFKLTEEQVKVRRARVCRSRAAPRWPSPDVPGSRTPRTPRLARVRFLNFSAGRAHHPRQKTRVFSLRLRV